MTDLEHTSFDKQKKSTKITLLSWIRVAILKKVAIVKRRLIDTLYAQQYSADFGVTYDIVDPTVKSTQNLLYFFR